MSKSTLEFNYMRNRVTTPPVTLDSPGSHISRLRQRKLYTIKHALFEQHDYCYDFLLDPSKCE